MATWRHFPAGKENGSALERRRHVRFAGDGLLVMIDGCLHPAADISFGGVRVASAATRECGTVIPLRVIPVVEEAMLLGQGARAEAQVVGHGRDGLRMVFLHPPYSLARLLTAHARRQRQRHPFA